MNAIRIYRIASFCKKKKIPIMPKLMKILMFRWYNSIIPCTAKIGKDTKCAYGGIGVVVHMNAVIGDRVIIGQNCTIGRALDPSGVPVIGNDVYISAGVRIIGNVKIGNNVIIGANAVVTHDIEDNSIVAGVPAKLLRKVDVSIWSLLKNVY